MECVAYMRVSTEKQAVEGNGLDSQKRDIENYCRKNELVITDWYIDDGYTGTNMDRPELQRLVNDCSRKRVSCVVAFKLDRLSRNMIDGIYLIEKVFQKYNVVFKCVHDGRFAPKGHGTYRRGYEEPPYMHMYPEAEHMRDMDRDYGKMYYTEPMSESNYDRAKRNYTETKEMHKNNTPEDKEHKMKVLDGYIKELGGDITQLIGDMTAEERNLMRTKLSTLVSKL